jgi:hypothetical protein
VMLSACLLASTVDVTRVMHARGTISIFIGAHNMLYSAS